MNIHSHRAQLVFGLVLVSILAGGNTVARAATTGKLRLLIVDSETQKPLPCRVHLTTRQGKPVLPKNYPGWKDHFVCPGEVQLDLPPGTYNFEIERGPEYVLRTGHFVIEKDDDDEKTVDLKRFVDMAAAGWWSGELHVHRPPADIELLMRAEDLHVAPVITWWNTTNLWAKTPPPAKPLVRFDENRYYHLLAGEDERDGGALLYFNLPAPLPIGGAEKLFPSSMKYLFAAREHPGAWINVEKPFWWDTPLWLASGKVDSIGLCNNHMHRSGVMANEAWGKPRDKSRYRDPWGNGQWTQDIYYHALNCGLRIPPSAGSASGVLPNPVGYNRVYVHCGAEWSYESWWESFRAGRVVVTNGPLLRTKANGQLPGHVFQSPAGKTVDIKVTADLATRDQVEYLNVIKDGKVERSVRLDAWTKANGELPPLSFTESGWFLIRVVTTNSKTYRFASTGPYYVEIGASTRRVSKLSAQFFLDWVAERTGQLKTKLTDPAQREEVLAPWDVARQFWQDLVARSTAP